MARHAFGHVLLLGGVLFAPVAVQQTARATLETETLVHDLGVIGLGTDPAIEFPLRNTGAVPLEIAVVPLPRPLRLVHVDKTIAPGGSGVLRLALDTFQAGVTTEWRVQLTTNDPDRATVELNVFADVRQFLLVTPPSARFNFVQYGAEGGTRHQVAALDEVDLKVLEVESPFPFIRAASREARAAERTPDVKGRQWQIDLTILEKAPVGAIGGHVIVTTNHPKQPRAFIPVTGFVRPLFAVTPPSVELKVGEPLDGDRPLATLVVKNFGADAIEITEATSDIAGLEAKVVPVDAGHSWRVELRLRATGTTGPFAGTLQLKTKSARVPVVTVPIKGSRLK